MAQSSLRGRLSLAPDRTTKNMGTLENPSVKGSRNTNTYHRVVRVTFVDIECPEQCLARDEFHVSIYC